MTKNCEYSEGYGRRGQAEQGKQDWFYSVEVCFGSVDILFQSVCTVKPPERERERNQAITAIAQPLRGPHNSVLLSEGSTNTL